MFTLVFFLLHAFPISLFCPFPLLSTCHHLTYYIFNFIFCFSLDWKLQEARKFCLCWTDERMDEWASYWMNEWNGNVPNCQESLCSSLGVRVAVWSGQHETWVSRFSSALFCCVALGVFLSLSEPLFSKIIRRVVWQSIRKTGSSQADRRSNPTGTFTASGALGKSLLSECVRERSKMGRGSEGHTRWDVVNP